MATQKPSKATALTQLQAIMAGIEKHFPNGQFTLGKTAYTTQTLLQALRVLEGAHVALNAAHASVTDGVAKLQQAETSTGPLLRDVKRFVLSAYASSPQDLTDFGLQAPKARKPLTSEQRATATAKLRATRSARGTKGTKQKAALKGNVTGVTVTPITEPSPSHAASPEAQPAASPAASSAASPAASPATTPASGSASAPK
jgi:hypothetical protein